MDATAWQKIDPFLSRALADSADEGEENLLVSIRTISVPTIDEETVLRAMGVHDITGQCTTFSACVSSRHESPATTAPAHHLAATVSG